MPSHALFLKFCDILKDAKVSEEPNLADGDINIVGQFEERNARFGVRKGAGKKMVEAFFQIGISLPADLAMTGIPYCPFEADGRSGFQKANLGIENGKWLTERIYLSRGEDVYFGVQSEESLREHFAKLGQLASRIEENEFSLKENMVEVKGKNERFIFLMLLLALLAIVFAVAVISGPVVSGRKNFNQRGVQKSTETRVLKKQTVQKQVAYGVRERRIVPSNSNIFLNVIPDRTSVPMGEKVILNYSIFTRFGTKYWGFYNEGKFQNFRVERNDIDGGGEREVVQYKGKKFIKFDVGTVSLFPLKTEKQQIYPGAAFVSVRSEKGDIMDMYLNTKPLEITVLEPIDQSS